MLSNTLKRSLRTTTRLKNAIPSSKEMKSESLWTVPSNEAEMSGNLPSTPNRNTRRTKQETAAENSFTNQLMGFTKTVVEADPPLNILSRFTKRFKEGETYDAFDFSATRIGMDRKNRKLVRKDPFEATGINPRNLYTMPEILSKFLTSTGQILPRSMTGCSDANQKKLSMAIKTARASGLLSTTHRLAKFIPSSLL